MLEPTRPTRPRRASANPARLAACGALAALSALAPRTASPAPPAAWEARGVGGGGALFSPSFSPHAAEELYLACDMSELFHTTDLGLSWSSYDFRVLQGNRGSRVQFTSDPSILYVMDYTSVDGVDLARPMKSVDGGAGWSELPGDPTGGAAYGIWADPARTDRLLVNDWNTLYFSGDGGLSFAPRHTGSDSGAGLHVAGALFAGSSIYVGTNDGLLVSSDGGASFAPAPVSGIPAGESIVGFAGAQEGAITRFLAVTADPVWNGIEAWEHWGYRSVYTLDWGAPAWVERTSGIDGDDHLWFAGMALDEVMTAYVAGTDTGLSYPVVYKTTDGGASWTNVLDCVDNANVATGWSGYRGDRDWWYGEVALGFGVSPVDEDLVAISDFGFIHLSDDGGSSWRQAYVSRADEHPAGAATPTRRSYHSIGLEDTTAWCVVWADATNLVACNSDIRGMRSTDGGASFGFDYSGHTENSLYRVVRHPDGTLYGATASVHDLYQSTYLQDSRIDGGAGRVIASSDAGRTWTEVHDFGHVVAWVALDPSDPERLYAAVVHASAGDVYVTDDLSSGPASSWRRLASPPRTEGHPFNVIVLSDGTLVASYSGRRDAGGAFTASSGVFVSPDAGLTWIDRSHGDMHWWTKDVVVDPHDPTESTWYVGVWSGWGGPANDRGGLFRTRDRGLGWTRILTMDRASSVTIHPSVPDEAYLTSETKGLWHTPDIGAAAPVFTETSYPFRQPERVFFNPYDAGEIWVTSFGNGLKVGASAAPGTGLLRNKDVFELEPVTPAKATILPLDPAADLYVADFLAGDLDPQSDVVDEPGRPLVFYALDGAATLRLVKTPAERIAIHY